jgi:uncharacterized delta-60 repeat protein
VKGIVLLADSKILISGGTLDDNGNFGFYLMRLLRDGNIDTSFGNNGKAIYNTGASTTAYNLVVLDSGKILAAGYTETASPNYAGVIFQFFGDGSPDTAFGEAGKMVSDHNLTESGIAKLEILPDGGVLGAGTCYQPQTGYDFAIARYEMGGGLPVILNARIEGKNLIVEGANFENGAEILLNGVRLKKVSNSPDSPKTQLIAKKAKALIAPGQTVSLQVRNPNGELSTEFTFIL